MIVRIYSVENGPCRNCTSFNSRIKTGKVKSEKSNGCNKYKVVNKDLLKILSDKKL